MRTDTKITRRKIIATAERLFAERGIDAVSLNEINTAAEQKNKSGLHYHFGSKAGLVDAIIEKHAPGINESRHRMLDTLQLTGDLSLENVVRALVIPIAEKIYDIDGGISFIRVNAQLVNNPNYNLFSFRSGELDQKHSRLLNALAKAMPDSSFSEELRIPRILMVSSLLFHSLESYSRIFEEQRIASDGDRPDKTLIASTSLFISTLVDAIVAILSAPLSESTIDALAQLKKIETVAVDNTDRESSTEDRESSTDRESSMN